MENLLKNMTTFIQNNTSKAVGEPPIMYGIVPYFAIHYALKVFNPNYDLKFQAPLTPEKVLMGLSHNKQP
jgi:xanthine dehydrogenase large subunit